MRKSFIKLIMLCFGVIAFADAYTVKSVDGKVTYEDNKGHSIDVKTGMQIESDWEVSTGLNSALVVTKDGKDFTVKPMKKGKLSDLASSSSVKTGVKIGSKVTKKDIARAAGKTTKGVSTASSRASEAKADVEWEE
ncbi:hypothetical protein [Treponema sp.]|uniref:hypothetical protein n=1 Tax=Treponema sp. TaxID=166 RepID=UPI00388E9A34